MNKKYIKPEAEIIRLQTNDIIRTSGEAVEPVMPKAMINSKAASLLGETKYTDVFK